MAKQLNSLTGKGYLLAKGQQWVEEYLETHTQAELAILAGYTKNGGPNAGAVSVALKSLGWASFNGQPVKKQAQQATSSAKPQQPASDNAFIGPPVEKFLPGRIELLLDVLGHDLHITGVMAAIEEKSKNWCIQVRRMGDNKKKLMVDRTGRTAWTLADIAHEKREEIRQAPFKRSIETVAAYAEIDSRLLAAEAKFEQSRYDAEISAFYCAD